MFNIIPRHFRALRTAEAGWTKYQHLTLSSASRLQGQLHAAQTSLNDHKYNIATIRNEQNRLRDECSKAVEDLESQIAVEEKLIAAEDLNDQITLIQQIIALHRDTHA